MESRRQPAPHGTHRPRAVPAHPAADRAARAAGGERAGAVKGERAGAAGGEARAPLENLDGQIATIVLRRAELAWHYHALRRTAWLPQPEPAWESQVPRRYAALLGTKDVDIGRAVLALSQAARGVGRNDRNGGTTGKEKPFVRTTESARGDPPR
ncbi:hypothetical protein [Streptomyces sp. NPDC003480]